MARLIPAPPGGGPPNAFEQLVLEALLKGLSNDYQIMPNFVIKPAGTLNAYEIDLVVLGPQALYVVECKEWYGEITGDDTEWLINGRTSKPKPMHLTDLKCKVLKTHLGQAARSVNVKVLPLIVIPNDTKSKVGGGWAPNLQTVRGAIGALRSPIAGSTPLSHLHAGFIQTIQGAWGKRLRTPQRKVGNYDLEELMGEDSEAGRQDWRAKRALIDDPTPYRLRVWTVPPDVSLDERKRRIEVIKRPTVAVRQIKAHPNLLQVLDFGELPDTGGFYEVTEWSEEGTLYAFLSHLEQPLTIRERLELALGVAEGLMAIHQQQVVHRNLCPESILVGFDRRPRLTDFDRAWVDQRQTVFAAVRHRNLAYVPPELADPAQYKFGPASDAYGLGVLLFALFVGQPPFPNPQAASAAEGSPYTLPSKVVAGVAEDVDEVVLGLLNVDQHDRPSLSEVVERLHAQLSLTTELAGGPLPATPGPVSFEPGMIVDGYRVEGMVGEGSFARVYRVLHIAQGKYWAMKVVKKVEDADIALKEWGTGDQMRRHPNIAEIRWFDRLPPPDERPYVICELVEGESLAEWCAGRKTMPLSEVRRIGARLLDALAYLHPPIDRIAALQSKTLNTEEQEELERLQKSGFLHRDIKPNNILLDRRNEPKLIDFNIATPAHQADGRPGTPRYWARDRGQGRPGEDLFSLGVVLYELAIGAHPYPNDNPSEGTPYRPEQVAPEARLSTALADFLFKAVQPLTRDRFQTAMEMKGALEALPALHRPEDFVPDDEAYADLALQPDEVGRLDYNPFVTRLLTLYSQARVSNAGTRGLDDIARLTYVKTLLDTRLAPALLDGQFRLVIITGNAGDGKTAFLQQLEEQFKPHSPDFWRLENGNGAAWTHNGVHYSSNYDGSQDEEDRENDAVLAEFFAPFKGRSLAGLGGKEAGLIAINEGRLRDFLDHAPQAKGFEGLRQAVTAFFTEGKEPPTGLLILNLNLRAVAAGQDKSLVEQQLKALLEPRIWAPCESCQYRHRCPLLANARTLSDPASGAAVRERVRRLFEIVHLRRQQHVTMRDLRSALSWLLLRDTRCADVATLLTADDANEQLITLSYTEAFAPDEDLVTTDRLVRALRDVDVGQVENPELDRRLSTDPGTAVPWMVFGGRGTYVDEVWQAYVHRASQSGDHIEDLLKCGRGLLRRLRRRAWFERRDGDWAKHLPYRTLEFLEPVIRQPHTDRGRAARDVLKGRIIEAISMLEGVRHLSVRRASICLRASRVKGASALSFRLFDASRFSLEVDDRRANAAQFLEIEPDTVALRATDEGIGRVELRLTLDLVEMLDMVRRGFRPNPSDMGGLFVNLIIFRNALLHLPYQSVLVTIDNEDFYEVVAYEASTNQIGLRIDRKDVLGGGL